ncbi:hypothetical protein VCRA2119O48_200103 [Vibrio crassostreae]|nr:hypothetical protein VCRA2119O48_200103 [Vibrio crassostreae]CAK3842021.1 hypothetical protein VCRA212O16_210104 [Vibrio crassostreae]
MNLLLLVLPRVDLSGRFSILKYCKLVYLSVILFVLFYCIEYICLTTNGGSVPNFITLTFYDLPTSEIFYVDVLGFKFFPRYEPTRWFSLCADVKLGSEFGLIEISKKFIKPNIDKFDCQVLDPPALLERIGGDVKIISVPEKTDLGGFKAVIGDPFNNRFGFCSYK